MRSQSNSVIGNEDFLWSLAPSGELRPGLNWLFIILVFFANILCNHVCNREKSMCLLEVEKNTPKKCNNTFL